MASLKYVANADLQTVTLASNYTAGSGTMTLTTGHGARLPSSGDFWIRPKTGTYQAFKVTARSTDTLTVVGGADGTTDANIASGTDMQWIMGVAALEQLKTDIFTGPVVPPPAAASWTGNNAGTSTLTDVSNGVRASFQVAGSTLRMYELAVPGSTFTLTAKFAGSDNGSFGRIGIHVRNNSTSKMIGYGTRNDGPYLWTAEKWTTPASWTSSNFALGIATFAGGILPTWCRIKITASNIEFYLSLDAVNYDLMGSETLATWLGGAPTHMGIYSYDNNGSSCGITLLSWEAV